MTWWKIDLLVMLVVFLGCCWILVFMRSKGWRTTAAVRPPTKPPIKCLEVFGSSELWLLWLSFDSFGIFILFYFPIPFTFIINNWQREGIWNCNWSCDSYVSWTYRQIYTGNNHKCMLTHTKVRRRPDRVTIQLLHTHAQTSKNSMKLDTININIKSLLQLVYITTGITVLVGTKNS